MIDIIIEFNGKKNKYKNIPTSWHDFTTEHFFDWLTECALDEKEIQIEKQLEYLSVITRIPIDILKHCPINQLKQLSSWVDFAFDFDALNNYKAIPKEFQQQSTIDIGLMSYEKIETAKDAYQEIVKNKKHPLSCSVELLKIYANIDASKMPITATYGILCFFFNSWIPFLTNSNA